jgi:hypothetical protein
MAITISIISAPEVKIPYHMTGYGDGGGDGQGDGRGRGRLPPADMELRIFRSPSPHSGRSL